MTKDEVTRKGIDSVNDDPETQLAPTRAAPQSPQAYSAADAETLPYPDDDVSAYTDTDERAYSWRTVQIFVGLMAVAVLAATWMVAAWWTHREDTASTPTSAAPTVQPSPDDHIVAAAPAPAPAAVPPPVVDDDAYVAAAISFKTMKSWYGMAGSDYRARSIAMTECKTVIGADDCVVAESTFHGCIAVVMDKSGNFSGGKGPDADSAKADAYARYDHPGQSWFTTPVCSK